MKHLCLCAPTKQHASDNVPTRDFRPNIVKHQQHRINGEQQKGVRQPHRTTSTLGKIPFPAGRTCNLAQRARAWTTTPPLTVCLAAVPQLTFYSQSFRRQTKGGARKGRALVLCSQVSQVKQHRRVMCLHHASS